MGLEAATYISGLNANNPVNATDNVSEGDDHLRLIKSTLLNTFPNITGAMNASHTELNNLVGVTGKTGTGNVVLSASPTFTGTITGLAGSGASLTALNASQLTTGIVPDARIVATSITQHQASINHDALLGFVANEHLDHSSIRVIAGSGLTGGGTIAADRTLNVGAGDGISVAADSVAVDGTVVRTSGAQTIAGVKTFSNDINLTGTRIIDATVQLSLTSPKTFLGEPAGEVGFFGPSAFSATKQTVTGATVSIALASLLNALHQMGLVTDNSTF